MKQGINGSLIKDYISREGRKYSWVAAQLGISESVLYRMVNGYAPKTETIKKLAKLLNVKVSQLTNSGDKAA